MTKKAQKNIKLLKAISDPSRYKILKILMNSDGTLCVNEIAKEVEITPSAVSHQLAKLEDMVIVEPKRRGQNVCYTLTKNSSTKKLEKILSVLE